MKNNIAKDSILLTIIRTITLGTSMIQIMILSRIMNLTEYGTYSELLIIISLGTTIAGLGLNNAINFFFNKGTEEIEKKKYINTIFGITILSGLVFAALIYTFRELIANYYSNSSIKDLIIYVIFKPLLANIILLYQPLYISINKTKTIAIRNLIISVIQVIAIPIAFYLFRDILSVLIISLILDICQLIYFGFDFSGNIKINFFKIEKRLAKPILKYAIPMALASMIGNILKESDKIVIAKMASLEELAIYTNMSKQLPFEFIVISFTTVITPAIINLIGTKRNDKAIELWKNYIEFGYYSTWILCTGAIICSKELLILLYSEKYISGLPVFIIYLFLEMFKYTYFGLILSAIGKTKDILLSSGIALIFNVIFNIIFYIIFGSIGPALASLICITAMGIVQLILSCKELKISFFEVIEVKKMIVLIRKISIIAIPVFAIKLLLRKLICNDIIVLAIIYTFFVSLEIIINKKRLIYLIRKMGKIE